MHGCSKRSYFHLSLKLFFFFNIFAHIFLNHVPHKTQNSCYKLNKFCNLMQLWHVIISMMSFYFFNCTKNSTHLKIMVPGLRGPAGGPCKSEDITGWGLKNMSWDLSNHPEIGQGPQLQSYWGTCRISGWFNPLKTQSCVRRSHHKISCRLTHWGLVTP